MSVDRNTPAKEVVMNRAEIQEFTGMKNVKFSDFDSLIGKNIYVSTQVSGGTGWKSMMVAASGFLAYVENETEKAVKLKAKMENEEKYYTAWFPKKALVRLEQDKEMGFLECDLAKWFNAQGWTAKFLNLVTTTSVIAA